MAVKERGGWWLRRDIESTGRIAWIEKEREDGKKRGKESQGTSYLLFLLFSAPSAQPQAH